MARQVLLSVDMAWWNLMEIFVELIFARERCPALHLSALRLDLLLSVDCNKQCLVGTRRNLVEFCSCKIHFASGI